MEKRENVRSQEWHNIDLYIDITLADSYVLRVIEAV